MKKDYYTITVRHSNRRIKILIIILLLIFGCETTQTPIEKASRNPKCEDLKSFKVFQVLDKYVLASVCEDDYDLCMGHTVYFAKEKGKIYFDDQKIKVKNNECAIYTGTFRYQTRGGGYKTVPIVKIIDSQNFSPE